MVHPRLRKKENNADLFGKNNSVSFRSGERTMSESALKRIEVEASKIENELNILKNSLPMKETGQE